MWVTALLILISLSNIASTEVSCYFPSFGRYRAHPWNYTIDNVPSNSCDLLIYAFVGVTNLTWKINILDSEADVTLGGFTKAVAIKKRSPATKVLVALGGYSEGVALYSDMVESSSNRAAFIKDTIRFIEKYKFDGMDLDWEFPGDTDRGGRTTDKDKFTSLVKEMSAEFKKRNWLLTAALTTFGPTVEAAYDVAEISKYLDKLHIMTYDMRGPWSDSKTCDNHSPLYRRSFDKGSLLNMNVKDTMAMYVKLGAPKSKLYVGVPFYGRTFTLKDPNKNEPNSPINGVGNAGEITGEAGLLSYFEICTLLKVKKSNGQYLWSKGFDSVAKVPYAYTGDQWVGYDDASSVATKMQFIKDNGYAGAMTWSVDQDDFLANCGGVNPLLNAMKNN